MSKRSDSQADPNCELSSECDLVKLLHTLIDRCDKPAQLVEILYWHEEAELAEVMRLFLALPAAAKSALLAFLVMSKDNPASITAAFSIGGLTLSSPMIAEYFKTTANAVSQQAPTSNLH
jgi:hypothetical protein